MYKHNLFNHFNPGKLNPQNELVASLIKNDPTMKDLRAQLEMLASHYVLDLFRFDTGANSAITPKELIHHSGASGGNPQVIKLRMQLYKKISDGENFSKIIGLRAKDPNVECEIRGKFVIDMDTLLKQGHSIDYAISQTRPDLEWPHEDSLRPQIEHALLTTGRGFMSLFGIKHHTGLEAALENDMWGCWHRDSMMQADAEYVAFKSPTLSKILPIAPNAWFNGINASLTHLQMYDWRATNIIEGRQAGTDLNERWNAKFNPLNLREFSGRWGNGQDDALGQVIFEPFLALNQGDLSWDGSEFRQKLEHITTLVYKLFFVLDIPNDYDNSAWEEYPEAEHMTSLLVVAAMLSQVIKFVRTQKSLLRAETNEKDYMVSQVELENMLALCLKKFNEVLPFEFIRSRDKSVRKVDLGLLNGLYLMARANDFLVPVEMIEKILDNIDHTLMGDIGDGRYPRDRWDGEQNRNDIQLGDDDGPGEQEQWTHGAAQKSVICGRLCLNARDASERVRWRQRQVFYWNRWLSSINERFNLPEGYIIDPFTRKRTSNKNESLAWSSAVGIPAYDMMEQTTMLMQYGIRLAV